MCASMRGFTLESTEFKIDYTASATDIGISHHSMDSQGSKRSICSILIR
jgi:hypothetical protein